MEREFRVLSEHAGVIVLGRMERLPRGGMTLECTRSFDVVNRNPFPVVLDSVYLRGSGPVAACRPPFRYELLRDLRGGERLTVLDEVMFHDVRTQTQVPGAVRPFESRLKLLDRHVGHPPQVHLRVRLPTSVIDVAVPVVQLASDALGRLFHVRTLAG